VAITQSKEQQALITPIAADMDEEHSLSAGLGDHYKDYRLAERLLESMHSHGDLTDEEVKHWKEVAMDHYEVKALSDFGERFCKDPLITIPPFSFTRAIDAKTLRRKRKKDPPKTIHEIMEEQVESWPDIESSP